MERIVRGPLQEVREGEILLTNGMPHPALPERSSRSEVAIVHSPGATPVARRVADKLATSKVYELSDREDAKTLEQANRLYEWLSAEGIGRHDTIVGVGGGAATDVAGFVAATWLRGVEFVAVPTTLLGAVDAAIGGKTGINLGGKNLVGAFHLPTRVVIDLDVLEQLPPSLRLEGIAEALKAGYLGDADLVSLLQQSDPPLAEVVRRAVAVKVGIVNDDFREGDQRAFLNFGHTIGHAVEILAPMPHGLAVAVGMVAAAAVSAARYGFDSRGLVETVFGLGLPVAASGIAPGPALALIRKDKKRTSDGVRMVLLRAIGDPVVEPVSDDLIELGLASIGIT
ncbi:3-dehydroquinate synthase [soil metagenome]